MTNYNKVLLMGRFTRDPELRYTPQGTPVTDIGLAVNREFSSRQGGDRRKETVFVDITFWSRRAEVLCQYFKKGDPIFVEGRLTLNTWETQDGQKRSKLKVTGENFEFLQARGDGGGGSSSGGYTEYAYPGAPAGGGQGGPDSSWGDSGGGGSEEMESIDDSEIPF